MVNTSLSVTSVDHENKPVKPKSWDLISQFTVGVLYVYSILSRKDVTF